LIAPKTKPLALAVSRRWFGFRVWDVDKWQTPIELKWEEPIELKSLTQRRLVFSPDGKRLAITTERGLVRNPEGKGLVLTMEGTLTRVWDLDKRTEPLVLKGRHGTFYDAAFSPDGKRLASASPDGSVRLWDLDNGQESLIREADYCAVRSLVFSPDGKQLAGVGLSPDVKRPGGKSLDPDTKEWVPFSVKCYATILLWDLVKMQKPLALQGHTADINSTTMATRAMATVRKASIEG
jgi:WD40 repeat protein